MITVLRLSALSLLMLCTPPSIQADVGLPMIVPMGSLMILALLPIIGIEAWVVSVRLHIEVGAALGASAVSNLVSTIIGIPVNWFIGGITGAMANKLWPSSNVVWKKLLRDVFRNLFWIPPGDHQNAKWIIPSAQLILLVPLCFVSWLIESPIVSSVLEDLHADSISSAVFLANVSSYGLLALLPVWLLFKSRTTLSAAVYSARGLIYDGPTPDGRHMTADHNGLIRYFYAGTRRPLEVLGPIKPGVFWEAITSDGRLSVGRDERGHAIWENATGKEVCRLHDNDSFDALAFSPNAEYLATVGMRSAGTLWDCRTGNVLLSCNDCGHSIAFSPDSRMLALSGGNDDNDTIDVHIWDLKTCKPLYTLSGYEVYPVLKFSADGHHLSVGDYNKTFIYRTTDWKISDFLPR